MAHGQCFIISTLFLNLICRNVLDYLHINYMVLVRYALYIRRFYFIIFGEMIKSAASSCRSDSLFLDTEKWPSTSHYGISIVLLAFLYRIYDKGRCFQHFSTILSLQETDQIC